jgi:hypothetical protein
MLQAAKDESEQFSDTHLEAWIKYVGVMREKDESKKDNYMLDIQWFGQFNPIFQIPCGCWPTEDCNGVKIIANQCCNRATNKILKEAEASTDRSQQIIIAQTDNSDCGSLTGKATEFKEAIRIIDKSLKEHELPIMVGVHHPYLKDGIVKNKCSSNTPKITNHYIIIRGKKYDNAKKQYYYLFHEVGTRNSDNGKSLENRLYINEPGFLIKGNTKYVNHENYYTITEIRKNTGQTY